MIHRFSQNDDSDLEGSLPLSQRAPDFRSEMEQEYPLIQQHDMASADLTMAHTVTAEAINVTGAQVEVFLRTDNANFDHVWDEDADPTYWPGIICKAFFVPKPLEIALKEWNLDTPVKLEIVFAYDVALTLFGPRLLRMGDVIKVPFNAVGNVTPKNFRVVNASPAQNYKYSWLCMLCTVEALTGDITVQPEPGATHTPIDLGED